MEAVKWLLLSLQDQTELIAILVSYVIYELSRIGTPGYAYGLAWYYNRYTSRLKSSLITSIISGWHCLSKVKGYSGYSSSCSTPHSFHHPDIPRKSTPPNPEMSDVPEYPIGYPGLTTRHTPCLFFSRFPPRSNPPIPEAFPRYTTCVGYMAILRGTVVSMG